jgi:structural maintenance of chromosome 3 (chondroitin sulfate proteoglycan 6)
LVVDTDETASQILFHLNREKAGRITFVPLNRLKVQNVDYPQGDDIVPMMSILKYDQRYEKAIKQVSSLSVLGRFVTKVSQVFSKAVICPNLDVASSYATDHGFTGITLEGAIIW